MNWTAPSIVVPYWLPVTGSPSTPTAFEQQSEPVKTGLLDADGRPIMRSIEVRPIGFLRLGAS